jgi:hypothetical protein
MAPTRLLYAADRQGAGRAGTKRRSAKAGVQYGFMAKPIFYWKPT